MAKNDVRDDVLKKEFAVSRTPKMHKAYYVILAVVAVVAVASVLFFMNGKTDYYVDWEAYGKALSNLQNNYDDYDKVILKIDNSIEVTKEEYYKLKIMNDLTFNALLKEYDEYIKKYGAELSATQKAEMKPKPVTDDEIINNLILLELGYMESQKYNIFVTYETAYAQVYSSYESYQEIIAGEITDQTLYNNAKDSLEQMQLVAKGMNITIEQYISYLANDSIKNFAVAQLEARWQNEFQNSNYSGTVDDYIDQMYDVIMANHSIEKLGLE